MADTVLTNGDYLPSDVCWLPEDLTGERVSNFITNENHPVTSLSMSDQRLIITPYYGAFYYDNYPLSETVPSTMPADHLTVTLVKEGTQEERILNRDSDYQVRGLDFGRTQASSSKYGVYSFILLTQSLSGYTIRVGDIIRLSYHAFGGNINYRNLRIDIDNLVRRISELEARINASYVTTH